jgi:organic radical activating enzyme
MDNETIRVCRLPDGRPEIFQDIQGEGPTAGKPSLLLRLAGCNLRCGYCDTKYAWEPEGPPGDAAGPVRFSADGLSQALDAFTRENLVVTGGEPLLQQEALVSVLREQKRRKRRIEVETNGTIAPLPNLIVRVDQWNVSPKLSNAGLPLEARILPAVLREFARLPNAWFKFVIQEGSDAAEAADILDQIEIPRGRALLMAEGADAGVLRERDAWLEPLARQKGFGHTRRLHLLRRKA